MDGKLNSKEIKVGDDILDIYFEDRHIIVKDKKSNDKKYYELEFHTKERGKYEFSFENTRLIKQDPKLNNLIYFLCENTLFHLKLPEGNHNEDKAYYGVEKDNVFDFDVTDTYIMYSYKSGDSYKIELYNKGSKTSPIFVLEKDDGKCDICSFVCEQEPSDITLTEMTRNGRYSDVLKTLRLSHIETIATFIKTDEFLECVENCSNFSNLFVFLIPRMKHLLIGDPSNFTLPIIHSLLKVDINSVKERKLFTKMINELYDIALKNYQLVPEPDALRNTKYLIHVINSIRMQADGH